MTKFYRAKNCSWGETPINNAKRYGCDTYFKVEENKCNGFVRYRGNSNSIPKGRELFQFINTYATEQNEISEQEFLIAARDFFIME